MDVSSDRDKMIDNGGVSFFGGSAKGCKPLLCGFIHVRTIGNQTFEQQQLSIRGGKVQAVGAIVGAVMKATKGQADAARVRELVLAACGQGG